MDARPALSDRNRRLWGLMERIEYCRHRAELAEASAAASATEPVRCEMRKLAQMWRELPHEYEEQDQLSVDPAFRSSARAE